MAGGGGAGGNVWQVAQRAKHLERPPPPIYLLDRSRDSVHYPCLTGTMSEVRERWPDLLESCPACWHLCSAHHATAARVRGHVDDLLDVLASRAAAAEGGGGAGARPWRAAVPFPCVVSTKAELDAVVEAPGFTSHRRPARGGMSQFN